MPYTRYSFAHLGQLLLKQIAACVADELEVPAHLVRNNNSTDLNRINDILRALEKTPFLTLDTDAEALRRIKRQTFSTDAMLYDNLRDDQIRLPAGSSDEARNLSENYNDFMVAVDEIIDATEQFIRPDNETPRYDMPLGHVYPVRPADDDDD